ncbi:MAG: hypothetical protein L0216_11570 [Planctomycetales bacterium]|nr:hypothetical protein [Planctomycetales bacterium]
MSRTRLAALAFLAGAPVALAFPTEEREKRSYDVSVLLEPVDDHAGPELNEATVVTDGGTPGGGSQDPPALFSAWDLADFVKGSVAPDSWAAPGCVCEIRGPVLEVVQTPAVQGEVSSLLGSLRRAAAREVDIRVRVIRATPAEGRNLVARTRDGSGVFARGEADKALAALGIGAPLAETSLTARDGQRVHAASLRRKPFVADYDVEVAQGAIASDPIVSTLTLGLVADVRPFAGSFRDAVTLEFRLSWAELPKEPGRVEATVVGTVGVPHEAPTTLVTRAPASAVIELPEPQVSVARGTAAIAGGETWVSGASGLDGAGIYFLVEADARDLPGGPAAPSGGPAAPGGGPPAPGVTRGYPLGEVLYRGPGFPGPSLLAPRTGLVPNAGEAEAGAGEPDLVTADQVVDWLKSRMGGEAWDQPGAEISSRGTVLIVRQGPEEHLRVEGLLRELAARRTPVFRTEACLLSAGPESAGLAVGGSVPAEAAEKAIAAAAGAGRFLAHATFTAQARQRGHVALVRRVPALCDHEVEVAQAAAVSDPIVRSFLEGIVWDARTVGSWDDLSAAVALSLESAAIVRPIRAVPTPNGPVSVPEVASASVRAHPHLAQGEWVVLRVGNDVAGRPMVLLATVRRAG